ncbi:hypothetical protein [Kitasatospora sp. NBC_00315]|uniref:hypothetical protein n=1 Tax=Kitasatospora sp. NBC_00315 TaxID=2975963 RepID=UPI003254C120
MRWTRISMVAGTVLAVTRARTAAAAPSGHRLIPPRVREVLRLLRITALPRPRRDRAHVLHWSPWRHHQHQGARAHRRWNNIPATATT